MKCKSIVFSILTFVVVHFVSAQPDDVPRYEIGGQFTIVSRDRPTPIFSSLTIVPDNFERVTRLGLGARFTYNLTKNIAVEAEGNFFPEKNSDSVVTGGTSLPTGKMLQAQFGVKAGKRFEKFGIFGKARPGFVRFADASKLTGTRTVTFLGQQFTVGEFTRAPETDFSTDIGGVVEFYPSRRTLLRFDIGDTIIRYRKYNVSSSILSVPYLTRPAETRHNLQFSTGIGFRF